MASDDELYQLALRVGIGLRRHALRLSTAESCTGGWLAKAITDVPGSSQWFERGYVSYSNEAKQQDLGVQPAILAAHGAVSGEVVEQMALGALRASGATLAIAISGVAGPDGGTIEKPVGLVWFALARSETDLLSEACRFAGDREAVRRQAVMKALQLIEAAVQRVSGAPNSCTQ